MKQSNTGINHTYQSSFTHNDGIYEAWHDGRYEMANDNYENIDIDTVKAKNIFAESVIDFLILILYFFGMSISNIYQ